MTLLLIFTLSTLFGSAESKGLADGALVIPSPLEAHVQSLGSHSESFGPLGHSQTLTAENYQAVPSLVAVLLRSGSPAAVAGLVVPIVVDAVDAVVQRWPRSKVFKKGGVTLAPALANGNPASSPVLEQHIIGVFAALNHFGPSVVFGRSLHGHEYNNSSDSEGRVS